MLSKAPAINNYYDTNYYNNQTYGNITFIGKLFEYFLIIEGDLFSSL